MNQQQRWDSGRLTGTATRHRFPRGSTLPRVLLCTLLASQLPVLAAEDGLAITERSGTASVVVADASIGPATQPRLPRTDWQPPVMPQPAPFAELDIDPKQARALAEHWGIELLGLRLTSAGYMLDFRFRVLEAAKSLALFDHRIKPYILVDRSKVRLPVPMAPKVGALRPTNRGKNIKSNKNYYMIFGNPDRYVKVGEKVTVVIGEFRAEHLTVN